MIGLLRTLTQMKQGRNNALYSLAFPFRELIEAGIVSAEVAERLLLDASTINGYVAKDGQREALATIRSALGIRVAWVGFTEQQGPDGGPR